MNGAIGISTIGQSVFAAGSAAAIAFVAVLAAGIAGNVSPFSRARRLMEDRTEPRTILVVDDDHGLRALIQSRLEREGVRAVGIDNGAEAVDWLGENRADLMLLDLKFPDMRGDELLRILADRKRTIPFVVITGQGDERAAVRMMKGGAIEYVIKDEAFLEVLPAVVRRALEQLGREARLAPGKESLHESRRTLLTLMSNLPGMAYRCRNDGPWAMDFVSEGCFDLTGYHPEDLIGGRAVSYARLIHPDDRASAWAEVQGAVARREPYRLTYRILAGSGEEKWVWEQGRAIFPAGSEIATLEGFVSDITERKRADEALRESERRFRELAENIDEVFWVFSAPQGRLLYVSPAYERVFGRSRESFYAAPTSFLEIVHPAHRERVAALLAGKGLTARDEEYRITRPDQSVRWISSSAFCVRDERGEVFRIGGISRDVTDRKRAEEQIRHSQKLEAVGTLASGVAHDFNNLLTAIFGYTALARKAISRDHPAQQYLDMADEAIQQASGVTRSLLTFSHKAATEKAPVDLGNVITDSLRLLRRVLPASVEVIEQVPANLNLWVNADATQLQQVLMNLAVNARDAMPKGGRLRISLRKGPSGPTDPKPADARTYLPRAILTVEDSGIGMSDDIRSRIFEPFFTTKRRGEGTGLGMSIVHGIVTDHLGRIRIDSEPGCGARVTISLPSCEPPRAIRTAEELGRSKPGRGEVILVVEDDEHIRSIVASGLRSEGYRVLQAADGAAAIQVIDAHAAMLRLLLLDVDLPKLNGLACLQEARARRANLPAILVTGSTEVDFAQGDGDGIQVLRKPFRMSDLTAAVARTLARPQEKAEEAVS